VKSVFNPYILGVKALTAIGLLTAYATLSAAEFSGDITSDTTWSKEVHTLTGPVKVKAPATLTIAPGAVIQGNEGSFLSIEQGAKIIADGSADQPIVFTSSKPVGVRKRSDWGGLILSGYAPINADGGTAEGEGGTGTYGGTNASDSSGILRYVRVEYAGFEVSPDNELNGISFQGVGNGTIVDYVQVHKGFDDGVEYYGGTVNTKHLLLTGNGDDSLDWTQGWQGKVQYLIVQQHADHADHAIEADNDKANPDKTPRSNPTIYNATFLGSSASGSGLKLRRGTGATLANIIVEGFAKEGIEIADKATLANATSGILSIESALVANNHPDFAAGETETILRTISTVSNQSAMLRKPFDVNSPDFRPGIQSAALDQNRITKAPSGGFFEPVEFIGGMGPRNDWTQGWTAFP